VQDMVAPEDATGLIVAAFTQAVPLDRPKVASKG